MKEQRSRGTALAGAVVAAAALWGVSHLLTHRLLAAGLVTPAVGGGYGGPLGPLVVATLGLVVLSTVVIAASARHPGGPRREPGLATVVAPAVFAGLETLTHLDAHHGAPPVGLVLAGALVHTGVVAVARVLWDAVITRAHRMLAGPGRAVVVDTEARPRRARSAATCRRFPRAWSGRAPPRRQMVPVPVSLREPVPT
ncbi:hypothetical protein Psed_4373 [Pseudonocardia dioxanivorans CB1190]|uniref:Uncharacterized protein n=1 Tax=Pseudonocardia dioxanivorans (strain ATCC 55486 / DSM 44775 / JCM 13855 / CB1190) TaxID=675635 RepID=F4CXF7_PSEUX|nr:hypothetical protein [Pseudonocardia dioxanivorans]AEA26531.1 hypothetical protein Psed_4373 [Pseudonocardia dioxanivorans CB1190]